MINNDTAYPIVYKKIPTQYAFYVSKDGTLQIQATNTPAKVMKFKNEKQARQFISKYKEII